MTNRKFWLVILVIALVFGMTVIGCGNGSTGGNGISTDGTYQGVDVQGNKYVLTIAESTSRSARAAAGDSYELTVTFKKDGTKITSRGTIKDITPDKTFILEPSVDGSDTFSIVINNEQISSVTGRIVLSDGEVFITPTFSTIYLRASRWGEIQNRYGEQLSTGWCINLFDFYGKVKSNGKYSITLSGTVDTALENTLIDIWLVPSGKTEGWNDENKWIGHSTDGHYVKIPRGKFKQTYSVQIYADSDMDQNNGEIMLELMDRKLMVDVNENVFFDAGKIPSDIPNGTIMAVIRDFSISITEIK